MTNVDDYFRQQLSNVIAEVQCSKLAGKLTQSYWNYKELIGCTNYVWAKCRYPEPCKRLYAIKDSTRCRYSGSEVAIRDMWDIYRGNEVPTRQGRLLDNGRFKYSYRGQVNKILDDTTHYFGAFWPLEVTLGSNTLQLNKFTTYRKDAFSKEKLCWTYVKSIVHIQLSLNLEQKDYKEELIRLKELRKEMKEIVNSVTK